MFVFLLMTKSIYLNENSIDDRLGEETTTRSSSMFHCADLSASARLRTVVSQLSVVCSRNRRPLHACLSWLRSF